MATLARQLFDGSAILSDWLGDGGKPVSLDLAQQRANVCATCPFNVEPLWWERNFKEPIAKHIRTALEVKNRMSLQLPNESSLHVCAHCGCCLPLKCWTPMRHIIEQSDPVTLKSYPRHCWVHQENHTP